MNGDKKIAKTPAEGRSPNREYRSIVGMIPEEEDQAPSANTGRRRPGSVSFGGDEKEDTKRSNDQRHEPANLDTMFSTASAARKAHGYQNWWDVEHD